MATQKTSNGLRLQEQIGDCHLPPLSSTTISCFRDLQDQQRTFYYLKIFLIQDSLLQFTEQYSTNHTTETSLQSFQYSLYRDEAAITSSIFINWVSVPSLQLCVFVIFHSFANINRTQFWNLLQSVFEPLPSHFQTSVLPTTTLRHLLSISSVSSLS